MWEVDVRFLFDAENDLTEFEAKELMEKLLKKYVKRIKRLH